MDTSSLDILQLRATHSGKLLNNPGIHHVTSDVIVGLYSYIVSLEYAINL